MITFIMVVALLMLISYQLVISKISPEVKKLPNMELLRFIVINMLLMNMQLLDIRGMEITMVVGTFRRICIM